MYPVNCKSLTIPKGENMNKYLIMIACGVVGAIIARKVPVIKDI
jgi:hypothetical protein